MSTDELISSQTFGEFFRKKRISLGYTLRSFCLRYDFDPGNISRLERNILPPTLDDDKMAGYAMALKIKRDTEEWVLFHDLAHAAKGAIPTDLRNNPALLSFLPAFYRTARGEKLSKKKIIQLVKLLNSS